MIVVGADETETLCCAVCGRAFTSLERSWLASPAGGGAGVWVHEPCLSGRAQNVLGTEQYRLRRGDFALRAMIERLTQPERIIPERGARDFDRKHGRRR